MEHNRKAAALCYNRRQTQPIKRGVFGFWNGCGDKLNRQPKHKAGNKLDKIGDKLNRFCVACYMPVI